MKNSLAILKFATIKMSMRLPSFVLLSLTMFVVVSCETTNTSSSSSDPQVARRNAEIAAEPRGSYYVGRRYHVESTRFWGYLREPGKSWDTARLVIMNESRRNTPDRLPEEGEGRVHGYDNNQEYRIQGHYTGRPLYDPNSNLTLPEFMAESFELVNPSPGFLFHPKERRDPASVSLVPPGGLRQWP